MLFKRLERFGVALLALLGDGWLRGKVVAPGGAAGGRKCRERQEYECRAGASG
jgi:hypothetical protein